MKSVWLDGVNKPKFEPLTGDVKTEVLIIGGGLAGLLCAYELKQAGVDCVLAEASEICGGITKNTTAKITSQHGLCYHKLLKRFGLEKARAYLEAGEKALENYRSLCKTVDCDFEEQDAFVYSLHDERVIEKELNALEKIGFSAGFVKDLPLPFPTKGAVKFERQAQFHPLKFAYQIARGLRIYEHTRVVKLTPSGAITENGTIQAEKIIVATHFPFLNKHGLYFMKMFQHRSYVLALKNAEKIDGMYLDENGKGLSFRSYGELLLLGGGSHRTGEQGGNWQELEEFAKEKYPRSQEAYRFATQDCMTLDEVPYIGRYSKSTKNLFVATGFNKWGMTSSMTAAEVLCDMLQGRKSPYEELFSPSRTMLRKQLFVNMGKTAVGLLTPTAPRCPHMGCALKYNPQEHSWDCGCHGSRFTEDKKLIDNPAMKDMK